MAYAKSMGELCAARLQVNLMASVYVTSKVCLINPDDCIMAPMMIESPAGYQMNNPGMPI
jgi:hypothetical protein